LDLPEAVQLFEGIVMHGKSGREKLRALLSLVLLMGSAAAASGDEKTVTLFLCGDVMTGRGIDQVLPCPSDPRIHESFVKDARDYVQIAEQAGGPIQKPVAFSYIWGDALQEWDRIKPDLRIINLETAITAGNEPWPGKGINYRMNPGNVPCLNAGNIDFCSLANNHTLDWGYSGLLETMEALAQADIRFAGAGKNLQEAGAPGVFEIEDRARVIVWALCTTSSGTPSQWAATEQSPGVNLIPDLSDDTIRILAGQLATWRRRGDILVVSIHWGDNWGYHIPPAYRRFAHRLIDEAGVDVIHGHSSHHPRPIEVYKEKLILYGCGDFINDYEGIGGYEEYRDDLVLMYFPRIDPANGDLIELQMTPLQIKHFRLQRAYGSDARWLQNTLNRHSSTYGTHVILGKDNRLYLD
jgi:poly-gamma-glutamate capsule biosynthesis protein CapA/YwtB (metallophosphatase superfamily)